MCSTEKTTTTTVAITVFHMNNNNDNKNSVPHDQFLQTTHDVILSSISLTQHPAFIKSTGAETHAILSGVPRMCKIDYRVKSRL